MIGSQNRICDWPSKHKLRFNFLSNGVSFSFLFSNMQNYKGRFSPQFHSNQNRILSDHSVYAHRKKRIASENVFSKCQCVVNSFFVGATKTTWPTLQFPRQLVNCVNFSVQQTPCANTHRQNKISITWHVDTAHLSASWGPIHTGRRSCSAQCEHPHSHQ